MKRVLATGAVLATLALAGCVPSGPTVATFEVAGQGTYSVELATPELIAHAKELLAGTTLPLGMVPWLVVRGDDGGVNAPWTWHIDPATLEFADQTTEVCDGIPEHVEDGTVTSDYYCPWSAVIVKITGPGA